MEAEQPRPVSLVHPISRYAGCQSADPTGDGSRRVPEWR